LDTDIKALNRQIEAMVRVAAPELVELHGVGVKIAVNSWSPQETTQIG
jgi:transposase